MRPSRPSVGRCESLASRVIRLKASAEKEKAMAEFRWGHCKNCKYFGSPSQVPVATEEARCLEPRLSKFELKVFGACGCNAFELRSGLPSEAEQAPMHVIP